MFSCKPLCLGLLLAALPGGDAAEAKKAIQKVLDDQVAAWNRGDLKGFMAGYQRSNETTFYSGGTALKGWDAVLERYEKKYQGEGKEMGKLTFRDLDIQVLGGDSAWVRGRFELKLSKDL